MQRPYHFRLDGETEVFNVSFVVDRDLIASACSCPACSGEDICWHRNYILAGKNQRLPEGEYDIQDALIAQLSRTKNGRVLLHRATLAFGEKERCRRCEKQEVINLKRGWLGKTIRIFLPKGRRYFCWACRWSW